MILTVKLIAEPTAPEAFTGPMMMGAWFPVVDVEYTARFTVCVVVACPSVAVNVAVEVPAEAGVQENSPVEEE